MFVECAIKFMEIYLPPNIKSNFDGYNYLSSLYKELINKYNENIVFDFNQVRFIEANLCAFLGSIFEALEQNNNTIKIININSNVSNILRKNNFLIPYGYSQLSDKYDTTLLYRKFTPKEDKEFYKYIDEQLLRKPDFPSHSELLGKKITESIFELYVNAITHGHCSFIHVCGQFFPRKPNKPLYFTIVDKGITIKENVVKYLQNNEMTSAETIEWAMQSGNTTKMSNIPGGLGLGIIFEFIKKNNGKIHIVSSDGYYEYNNNSIIKEKLKDSFEGTMVNLSFNLNETKHYSLIEENTSFKDIF